MFQGHWDKNLNVKELIETHKPSWVLELGAAGGKNTKALASMVPVVAIDIGKCPDHIKRLDNVEWITGVSYLEIQGNTEIEFASVDTDHNGWTLKKELEALDKYTREGAVICMHDTVAFKDTNGFHNGYNGLANYPKKEMEEGPTMTEAIIDFINDYHWLPLRTSDESCGAMAIIKA